MEMINVAIAWVKARWAERSTWDGAVLVGLGVVVLFAAPIMKYAALGAIAYGAYRIWEEEKA